MLLRHRIRLNRPVSGKYLDTRLINSTDPSLPRLPLRPLYLLPILLVHLKKLARFPNRILELALKALIISRGIGVQEAADVGAPLVPREGLGLGAHVDYLWPNTLILPLLFNINVEFLYQLLSLTLSAHALHPLHILLNLPARVLPLIQALPNQVRRSRIHIRLVVQRPVAQVFLKEFGDRISLIILNTIDPIINIVGLIPPLLLLTRFNNKVLLLGNCGQKVSDSAHHSVRKLLSLELVAPLHHLLHLLLLLHMHNYQLVLGHVAVPLIL